MPKDLETTVYASQLNQANAIKYGVEHFRRNRGYTMGSIYWQLNDPWPVASWSSVDYYGRYKALHYFAKRFYQPLALGLFNEDKEITVNIANESFEAFDGYIKAGVMKNDFTVVFNTQKEFSISPLSSLDVYTVSNADFNGINDAYFYAELYDKNGKLLARNIELGTKPKYFKFLKPSIKIEAENTKDGVYFTFTSNVLAKSVQVQFNSYDIDLEDNYFDLSNGEPYRIFAKTNLDKQALLDDISLLTVYDIPLRY